MVLRDEDLRRAPEGLQSRPAARAGDARDRSHRATPLHLIGDPDDVDGFALIAPPGRYPVGQGPYGTRDQAGNVAEWTADARGADELDGLRRATRLHRARSATTSRRASTRKRDGNDNDARVVRGGSWRQPSFIARSNLRDPFGLITTRAGGSRTSGFAARAALLAVSSACRCSAATSARRRQNRASSAGLRRGRRSPSSPDSVFFGLVADEAARSSRR